MRSASASLYAQSCSPGVRGIEAVGFPKRGRVAQLAFGPIARPVRVLTIGAIFFWWVLCGYWNKKSHLLGGLKSLILLVSRAGVEPTTRRLKVCCSTN